LIAVRAVIPPLSLHDALPICEIHAREKPALIVGGSGLYIKALTHGLLSAAVPDRAIRAQLNKMSLDQLREQIIKLDPETARKIEDRKSTRLNSSHGSISYAVF